MKAILIDAKAKTVTRVDYDGELESAYKLLGCDLIEAAYSQHFLGEDAMYVDEEGLLKSNFDADGNEIGRAGFGLVGSAQDYVGSGLIVGTDAEGNTVGAESLLEDIKANVQFLEV